MGNTNLVLGKSIEFLKGVGEARANLLKKELGIFKCADLLCHYPFRYIDRSRFYTVAEITADMSFVQLKGKITNIKLVGQARKQRLIATFTDESGSLDLLWFKSVQWIQKALTANTNYVVFGKPSSFNGRLNMVHPETELLAGYNEQLGNNSFRPVYPTTEKLKARGLDSKGIFKLMKTLFNDLKPTDFNEFLPQQIVNDLSIIPAYDALLNIHFPTDFDVVKKAQFRIKFEELFLIQMQLLKIKVDRKLKNAGYVFSKVGETFNEFYNKKLPFELTNAQKNVMKEIRRDLALGKQMNRLLQGDVGSGKTVVAIMNMLIAKDNGFQSCLMAPTEILAQQHFADIKEILTGLNVRVELLTGSVKASARKTLFADLLTGEIDLLIGTHALIEDTVQYKNLGLVIIDEQHRFGVAQRAKLWKKNTKPPHILVMTATPIPRTLAMTLYGDLEVSVIDELPPGRKPIKTRHQTDAQRLKIFGFMASEIAKGRQVYVVYPLIKESETLDYKDLEDGYESIVRAFPRPKYQTGIVHGQMKPADKDFEMQRFAKGETQILVSTTVIEVGVNVPNASVMIIESAEKFGLSQLHQLRGRVGRGADQSYCILVTGYKMTEDAKVRMSTMVATNDGFKISEVDLELRGPGNISGTQQSGVVNFKLANLATDGKILALARNAAENVLDTDPYLQEKQHYLLKQKLMENNQNGISWSRIS